MTIITLYTGNGVSLSPVFEEGRIESAYVRLIADDGKALQKGEIISTCADVLTSDAPNWMEIDELPDPDPDLDDAETLSILLGGEPDA